MTAAVLIRPLAEADIAAIVALDHDARAQNLREELTRTWGRVRVLRTQVDGPVLGYVQFWHVTDEIHLLNVAVAGAERRRGLGRILVNEVIAYAKEHRAERVLLEVRVSNSAAIALYQTLGFEEFNRRKRYYDDGEDAIEMVLTLVR